jgi:tetratricopeptide (TPR) repeat protein
LGGGILLSKKKKSKTSNSTPRIFTKPQPKPRSFTLKHLIAIGLMAAIAFIAYSNTFHVPFQFDDYPNIVNEPSVKIDTMTLQRIVELFQHIKDSNRFFAFFTFALNYYFGDFNVFGYHLVNLFIHMASGIFLYWFLLLTLNLPSLKERYGSSAFPVALFSSLLFISHPVQTQSVTYIVQRMTSMAGMFYLLSMLLYVKGRLSQGKQRLLSFTGALISYFLGIFSKENAAILPLFVALYEFYFFQNFELNYKRNKIFTYGVGAILVIAALFLLFWGKHYFDYIIEGYKILDFTHTEGLLTQCRVVLFYITLLIYPLPSRLNLDYDFLISKGILDPPTTLLSMVIIAGLIGYSLWAAKKRPLLSFFILWYFGNLLIESSVFPLELIYEHRLYLPSIGPFVMFSILGVKGWEKIKGPESRRQQAASSFRQDLPLSIFFLLISFLFCLGTYQRNKVWQDEITLWEDCAKKSPNKNRPHYNLGLYYYNKGRYKEATDAYKKAIHIKPNEPDFYNHLGQALRALHSYQEAIEAYQKAAQIKPDYSLALINLGETYVETGRYQEGLETLKKALQLKPNDVGIYSNIGIAFRKTGQYPEAIEAYQEAIRLKPDNSDAYNNLGLTYYGLRRYQEAIEAFKNAIRLNSNDAEYHYNLGVTYTALGNHIAAIESYKETIQIKRDHLKARFNLGLSYLILKEHDLALEQYRILRDLDKDRAEKLSVLINQTGNLPKTN